MSNFPRRSGILLHPTAIPGQFGIGTLGKQTHSFLDWLKEAGQSYWQICPLVPTGYGDSPYQGFSAFAGNPNLIDLENLIELGLLEKNEVASISRFPPGRVDYGKLIPLKTAILYKAWEQSREVVESTEFKCFREKNAYWLDDYCLFMAIKTNQDGKPWDQWPKPLKFKEPSAIDSIREKLSDSVEYHSFTQYIFDKQWKTTKEAASSRGIRIIGDQPIFVSSDSSDCWSQPELFLLDQNRSPTLVSGVPPDYFSATGQRWGNPLYNWETMEKNNFSWWISVLKNKLEQYDVLRIDHFRGFAACWAIPCGEETAVNGKWIPSPGQKLFQHVRNVLGTPPIIAEDLGIITEDVVALMKEFDFPGMKVLQFAFDSSEENNYLPHLYTPNCIVYTGTHDNDTCAGWYDSTSESDRLTAQNYLKLSPDINGREFARAIVHAAMKSVANLAVIPIQDISGLGSEARFNTPGTSHGNWTWRISKKELSEKAAMNLRDITEESDRLPD